MTRSAVGLYQVTNCDEMGCTVLALCAVTGLSRGAVENALVQAGIDDFSWIAPTDWVKALSLLGWDYRIENELGVFPIAAFMGAHSYTGSLLVVTRNTQGKGHVFAARGRQLVDFYTGGEIATAAQPPEDFASLRVTNVVRVWPKQPKAAT